MFKDLRVTIIITIVIIIISFFWNLTTFAAQVKEMKTPRS